MAAAATAVKLHLRASRLQEAAVILQERAWVQEAAGDLAKRGRCMLDVFATKSFRHGAAAAGAGAIRGNSGSLLPASRPTEVMSNDPVESIVANGNPVMGRDYHEGLNSNAQAQVAVAAGMGSGGQEVSSSTSRGATTEASLTRPIEEDDYRWETDPNGGWLASFP